MTQLQKLLQTIAILHGIEKHCAIDGDDFFFIPDCGGFFEIGECNGGDMGGCSFHNDCLRLDKACKLLTEINEGEK